MPCINKSNLFLVYFFLVFLTFFYKAAASETNDFIAESYYKQYLKDLYYEQGKEFYYRGNLQEAILKFQSALKCDPEYKPAQLFLKLINEKIAQQDSFEEGKISSQKQKKEESAKKKSALNYYKEGISYFNKANYPEAINKFKESLKLTPGYEPALRYCVLSEEKLARQISREEAKIIKEQKEAEVQAAFRAASERVAQGAQQN